MQSRSTLLLVAFLGCGDNTVPASSSPDAAIVSDAPPDATVESPLDRNRDRMLTTYLAQLRAEPNVVQSNGLVGKDLATTCDLWTKLDSSSQAVLLTLTHRMQGSTLHDGSAMLDHVSKLYRVIGGQGATASTTGSCGGEEYNRVIVSMDRALHDALLAANTHQGAQGEDGLYDLADIPVSSYWRDSQSLGGPHAPFDISDDTAAGAPRAQAQYFKDLTSAIANAPLHRMDLTDLVDPLALELDHVYDCIHDSNPQCAYINYGPLCAAEPSTVGTQLYLQGYGDFEPAWKPSSCTPHR